jgi:hypothetical protein
MTVPPRAPTLEAIEAQLQVHEPARPVGHDDDGLSFARVLAERDPVAQAEAVYQLVLGRPNDEGSGAADALRQGLHPVVLGMDLLGSSEGQDLDDERRRRVVRALLPDVVRYHWGLPEGAPAFQLLVDPDAAFVLAAHRVALGVPATRTQYDDSVRLVAGGHGREHLLRLLWRDPRARRRLFGPRRTRLGVRSMLRPQRSRGVFRAHVLAEESAVMGVLARLAEWEVRAADAAGSREGTAGTDEERVLARLAEMASALRRMSGHTEW